MPERPDPHATTKRAIQTQAEWFGELARDAWERGQAAIAGGDLQGGLRWLERAHRIAPDDPTVSLSLAAPLLQVRDARAGDLFERVARGSDQREAWIGLAAARFAQGDPQRAADAAGEALRRHALPDDPVIETLLTAIAAAVRAPGWIGVGATDVVRLRTGGRFPVVLTVDGGPCPLADGGALDPGWNVLAAAQGGVALLGSPIPLGRMRRVAGIVSGKDDGGLEGWAWHPAAPERPAVLRVEGRAGGAPVTVVADGEVASSLPLGERGRRFSVGAARLAGMDGPFRVRGLNGQELLGSPLDPGAGRAAARAVALSLAVRFPAGKARGASEAMPAEVSASAQVAGAPASARPMPARRIAVVVPVHGNEALTLACLDALERTMPAGTRVIVVDDAGPEPALARALDRRAGQRRFRLIRNAVNRGFPASANIGMRAALALAGRPDVLLLNSDALVTDGALELLRAATHAAPDTGTATPFSNDATLASYPLRGGGNPVPKPDELAAVAGWALRAGRGEVVDIPTAVGFCMYVRRECLAETGLFREDAFAQGYGEENDFCIRARHLGWRSVAVPGAFVAHAGGQSFGAGPSFSAARAALIARNLGVMERLHPGYHALVADFEGRDPLAGARRRLDRARFEAVRGPGRAVVVVTHDSGGGVERIVRERCERHRRDGLRPIVLRPVVDRGEAAAPHRRYHPGLCVVGDGPEPDFPNLVFRLPDEQPELLSLLRRAKVGAVEFHHMLGHHPSVLRLPDQLRVPFDLHVHDYALFCPRISLVGGARRYCGEPLDPADCDACVADWGRNVEEDIEVAALRGRSSRLLAAARQVVAPSADAAQRLRRHFPDLAASVQPHEDDAAVPRPSFRPLSSGRPSSRPGTVRRVAVVGGIGVEKGFDVLLACARDAARRVLPLEFVVVGHTIDDHRLFETGRVFVTGPYRDEEAVALIRAQDAHLAFLPSIWPETWCLTLGHAWRAGLFAAAFDIGAPAERIRRTGFGWLLPLGLSANGINNALLAANAPAGDECTAEPTGPTPSIF